VYPSSGFVTDEHPPDAEISGLPVLGGVANLAEIVKAKRPDRIVVNLAERRGALPVDALLDLRFSGVRIEEAAVMYEAAFGRVNTRRLRPSQLIFSAELGPQRWSMQLQTVYSFVIALVALVVAAPLMIATAIAVRLTSAGPILFRQTRVGLNGKPFTLYKFRSMVVNAEAGTGAVWAKRNDPRVTRIGGFLRKTRLDELPQLFNVLATQMSIVGPRPERPEFVRVLSEQIPFYRQRHAVKPGVTGWAQINYKYGESVEDTIVKLEYDLYYIKNLSPTLDAFIMFHTAKVMLFSSHGQ
jgi:exopolysaccharide biosynthesis polyprenyl glycosylphosphotransferase